MFVLTADQRSSRTSHDLVPATLVRVGELGGERLLLPPQRNAGDEIQALLRDADATLEIALDLLRAESWAIGIGIGEVDRPLPDDIRAARGTAFLHAREAVDRAKSSASRVAVVAAPDADAADADAADDAEAVLRLLAHLRERRSPQGWEVADLLARGLTQKEAARRLGVTPAAVSLRARAAGLRVEEQAIPTIRRLLRLADADDDLGRCRGRVKD